MEFRIAYRRIGDRENEALELHNLAIVDVYEKALDLLNDAIVRAEADGDPRPEYNLLVARGGVHEQLEVAELAMRDYASDP